MVVQLTVSDLSGTNAIDEGDSAAVTVTATLDAAAREDDAVVDVTVVGRTSDGTAGGTADEADDFSAVSDFIVTIPAGQTSATAMFTLTALEDETAESVETVRIRGAVSSRTQGPTLTVEPVDGRTVDIADNDPDPEVTLVLSPSSISENRGVSTVTATLDRPSGNSITVQISATATSPATAADFNLSANRTILIAAGRTISQNIGGPVTVTGVNDSVVGTHKSVTVSGAAISSRVVQPDPETLTITDDTPSTGITLTVSPATVAEDATGSARTVTVTATLNGLALASDAVVTVSVDADTTTEDDDFTAVEDFTVTITGGSTGGSATFDLIPDNDTTDEPDETVKVTGTTTVSGLTVLPSAGVLVTIADNDATPTVTLVLTPASIPEDGGSSTVTATLDHASSEATTIDISAAAGTNTEAGDFTVTTNKRLTIAAGSTTSTGTVTISANDNSVAGGNKSVTVSATAANDLAVTAPSNKTLTITDDDGGSNQVTLSVSPATVAEDATGSARTVTVTATLNGLALASDAVVTVSVDADTTTEDDDFTAVEDFTVTITGGSTGGSATFDLIPDNDTTDEPDETVKVTGTTTVSGLTVLPSAGVLVTIADNDATPTVTLVLTPASIPEDGGSSTVTATLDHASSEATTIDISAAAGTNTEAGDFTVTTNKRLTIAAGSTTSTGTVTISANDNSVAGGNKSVTVSATAANDLAVTAPSNKTLTIAAGSTTSTGTVTISANDNSVAGGNKSVTVSATAANDLAVTAPSNKTLTITDDDTPSTGITVTVSPAMVTLVLTPASILEDGGSSTVTATLDHPSSEDTTVTVSAMAVSPAVAADFTLSGSTLTIAAGSTTSTGTVTISANDNSVAGGNKSVTVSATAANDLAVTAPSNKTLTITDDDGGSNQVTLSVSPATVAEDATGSARTVTVTATLNGLALASDAVVTVSVDADTTTEDDDFTAVEDFTVTITGGSTGGSATFDLIPDNDTTDEPDETVKVTGTTTVSGLTVLPSAGVLVTIADNDATPTVTLVLTPASIPEDGGSSTVTATLDHASSEATTIDISAAAGTNTEAGDFTVTTNKRLTIAAGSTTSTGTVTISANDNSVAGGNKSVTVSATAANDLAVTAPSNKTLTITDDDGGSNQVTLSVSPATVAEDATGSARTVTVTATLNGLALASDDQEERIEASVTGVYPYFGYQLTERASAWAAAGYGEGRLVLMPAGGDRIGTDLTQLMAAVGLRHDLLSHTGSDGPALALDMDSLFVRTSTASVSSEAGDLAAVAADTSRMRLRLNGSWALTLEDGSRLTPAVDIGLRHDGGDAETGFGLNVGGGVAYAVPARGLTGELNGRWLLAHSDDDFREWGLSGLLRYDPQPSSERGISLSVTPSLGTPATGGVDALFSQGVPGGPSADNGSGADRWPDARLQTELNYGFSALGGSAVQVPSAGWSMTESGEQTVRLGWQLRFGSAGSLGMEASRAERTGEVPDHRFGIVLRLPLGTSLFSPAITARR